MKLTDEEALRLWNAWRRGRTPAAILRAARKGRNGLTWDGLTNRWRAIGLPTAQPKTSTLLPLYARDLEVAWAKRMSTTPQAIRYAAIKSATEPAMRQVLETGVAGWRFPNITLPPNLFPNEERKDDDANDLDNGAPLDR